MHKSLDTLQNSRSPFSLFARQRPPYIQFGMRNIRKRILKGITWLENGNSENGIHGSVKECTNREEHVLLEGVTTQTNKIIYGGKRKFYSQIPGMDIGEGWIDYPSGSRFEGVWDYVKGTDVVEVCFSVFVWIV